MFRLLEVKTLFQEDIHGRIFQERIHCRLLLIIMFIPNWVLQKNGHRENLPYFPSPGYKSSQLASVNFKESKYMATSESHTKGNWCVQGALISFPRWIFDNTITWNVYYYQVQFLNYTPTFTICQVFVKDIFSWIRFSIKLTQPTIQSYRHKNVLHLFLHHTAIEMANQIV